MGEKVGFTNCVFEKLCFFCRHYFYSVFKKKHSSCNKKCMLKKQKTCEKLWAVFDMVKCFCLVCFVFGFWGFVVGFFVFGKVAKVLKCLFFPSFWGFCGVGWFLHLLRCFRGFCVCFLLFRFGFCLFWFCFCFVVGLLLDCCWCYFFGFCVSISCFFLFFYRFLFFIGFCFFCFCCFGPPHLALNPLFSVLFLLFLCFFCFLFLFGGP